MTPTPEQLFTEYQPLAKKLAAEYRRRLPAHVLTDDISAAAMMGLWDAARRGAEHPAFEWYAYTRIRGSIKDELRRQDWLGRRARDKEPANRGRRVVSLDYIEHLDGVKSCRVEAEAEELMAAKERSEDLEERVARLPEREQALIREILAGKKQREIAIEWRVSEPRVSQLYALALARLSGRRPPARPRDRRAQAQREALVPAPQRSMTKIWAALFAGTLSVSRAEGFELELRRARNRRALPGRDRVVLEHWLLCGVAQDTAREFQLCRSSISEILDSSLKELGLTCNPGSVPASLFLAARSAHLGTSEWVVRESGRGATSVVLAHLVPQEDWLSALSVAEKQAIWAALEGVSRESFSAQRGISVRTTANQLTAAFRKLHVNTVSELRAECARVHVRAPLPSQVAA